jgi:release factor glutamine methyltransferase
MTVLEAIKKSSDYFDRKGYSSPRLDAEILLAQVLGWRRLDLYLHFDMKLTDDQIDKYRQYVQRRGEGEPVAYITGKKEFLGLEFVVGPGVLIPRPETEQLVELAVERIVRRMGIMGGGDIEGTTGKGIEQIKSELSFSFFEVGTGSGAIAVGILHQCPGARGWASEVSEDAMYYARINRETHNLEERLELLEGRYFEGFDGRVDVIISNPPYVRLGERELLSGEILKYEPHEALFAGERGTEILEKICIESRERLNPGGTIFFEISPMIQESMEEWLRDNISDCRWEFVKDYSKKMRFLILDFPKMTG